VQECSIERWRWFFSSMLPLFPLAVFAERARA
jgi:hypothetical protein